MCEGINECIISDYFYAVAIIVGQRLGCDKNRSNRKTFSVRNLAMLWNCTHFTLRLEFGKALKIIHI